MGEEKIAQCFVAFWLANSQWLRIRPANMRGVSPCQYKSAGQRANPW
jgi:hypothetical protein